jgi:hypothetical protein
MKELLITAWKPCRFDAADGVAEYCVWTIEADALRRTEPGVGDVLHECAGDD